MLYYSYFFSLFSPFFPHVFSLSLSLPYSLSPFHVPLPSRHDSLPLSLFMYLFPLFLLLFSSSMLLFFFLSSIVFSSTSVHHNHLFPVLHSSVLLSLFLISSLPSQSSVNSENPPSVPSDSQPSTLSFLPLLHPTVLSPLILYHFLTVLIFSEFENFPLSTFFSSLQRLQPSTFSSFLLSCLSPPSL